jgi:CHAD domain-containing protein
MAFKLELDTSFANEIARIARERIGRVIESLAEKPRPSAESIHSARKDLKSLRALLKLARGSVAEEVRRNENMIFRDIGRSLSALRDSHALLEALRKFAQAKARTRPKNPATQKEVRLDFIQKVRGRIEHEAVKELSPDTLKQLKENLRGTLRTVPHWFDRLSFEPGNEWEVFVGRGLRRTYRRGKAIIGQLETLGKENACDEIWHELRKSAKALGYQVRLLEEIDQLTDKLGDDHDLAVLRSRFLAEPYNPAETQGSADMRKGFIDSLDRRRRKLQLGIYQIAQRIYAEKPRQFERRICAYWSVSKTKPPMNNAQTPLNNKDANPRPASRPRRKKPQDPGGSTRSRPKHCRQIVAYSGGTPKVASAEFRYRESSVTSFPNQAG